MPLLSGTPPRRTLPLLLPLPPGGQSSSCVSALSPFLSDCLEAMSAFADEDMSEALTPEEAGLEMLECARYGEDSDLQSFLSSGVPVNFVDGGSNTALHKACANGHVSSVALLLAVPGVLHLPNGSGNYPLHWAAANGKTEIAKLLLQAFEGLGIDVLAKNSFGKSSLTEAFNSNVTDCIQVLLEHDTASEERLIAGVPCEDVSGADAVDGEMSDSSSSSASTTHVFSLSPASPSGSSSTKTLTIRELELKNADSPFTTEARADTTGLAIWVASLVLSRWVASLSSLGLLKDKSVLEVGAGCGVPGVAAAVYGSASSVTITDLNPEAVSNAFYNLEVNGPSIGPSTSISAKVMDWADRSTWPSSPVDVLLGADLVYSCDIVPLLLGVANGCVKGGGTFYYVAPDYGRDGLEAFIRALKEGGWTCVREEMAQGEMLNNPLASGDDEMMMLHFNEYFDKKFVLYEFRKN